MAANEEALERLQAGVAAGDAETLARLLAGRFSCRAFLPEPVPRSTQMEILRLAQKTASWCNSQPWQLLITEGAGTERFRQGYYAHALGRTPTPDFDFPQEYLDAYLERRRRCGVQLYQSVGIGRDDRDAAQRQMLENFRCFGAPHAAIVTTEAALGVYGVLDCGAYTHNFMLAAHALGVACIAQAALAAHPQFIRDHFGLPERRRIVCGISFGYADRTHPVNQFRTGRAGAAEAATWVQS